MSLWLMTVFLKPREICSVRFTVRIQRIDSILEICQEHLESTGSFNTAIDNLLAYAVLVRIYAEFELMRETINEEKLSAIEDSFLAETFNSMVKNGYRGMLSSRLSEFFGAFGDDYRAAFDKKRKQNQRAETFYNNIMTTVTIRHTLLAPTPLLWKSRNSMKKATSSLTSSGKPYCP